MSNPAIFDDLRKEIKETSKDCKFYRELCEKEQYNFDQTLSESNLEDIPYVNWNFFKESNGKYIELLRTPYQKLSHWTLSSSTSGDPSVVGRGPKDIEVFKNNYMQIFEEYSNMSSIKHLILFSPTLKFMNNMPGRWMGKRGFLFYRDITDIWKNIDISYLLRIRLGKTILYFITHFKKKAFIEIDGKLLGKSLEQVEHDKSPALIANSAPLMYKNFMDYLNKHKKKFDMPETFRIQTGGGGWDGTKGRVKLGFKISKVDFMEKLSDFFNIPFENFADLYGATETPLACGGHWSKKYGDFLLHLDKNNGNMVIRSIETLERVKKTKEPGIIEVITPYGVKTYTGIAVLLDDIIEVVDFTRCIECGREGIIFRITGRLTPNIGKGCSSFTNLYPFQ